MSVVFNKADLHIHTKYSDDCFTPLQEILKIAQKRSLAAIAITDHNTLKGALEAEKIAPEFNIQLIRGEEIDTKQGHLVALFINELIKPERDILETIREIHQQGGLAVIPHPLSFWQKGISLRTLYRIYSEIDGLETFNDSRRWLISPSRRKVLTLNYQQFNLSQIGVSDAHIKDQVGMGYTLFTGKTKADLYSAIKNNLTSSKKIKNFFTCFKVGLKLIPSQPIRSLRYFYYHGRL
ncbi:MAG: PHP domain-containing protein [Minisyncoccales bacterium]